MLLLALSLESTMLREDLRLELRRRWACRLADAEDELERSRRRCEGLRRQLEKLDSLSVEALVSDVASKPAGQRDPEAYARLQRFQERLAENLDGTELVCARLERYSQDGAILLERGLPLVAWSDSYADVLEGLLIDALMLSEAGDAFQAGS